MANCAYSDSFILFGGAIDQTGRYCNERCQQAGHLLMISQQFPVEEVDRLTSEVHQGNCPRCQSQGPVDMHEEHRIWSALSSSRVGARARRSRVRAAQSNARSKRRCFPPYLAGGDFLGEFSVLRSRSSVTLWECSAAPTLCAHARYCDGWSACSSPANGNAAAAGNKVPPPLPPGAA